MKSRYILSALVFSFALSSCQKSSEGSKRPTARVIDKNSINIDKYLDKKEALIDLNGLDAANLSKYQCAQSLCGSEYPFFHAYEKNPEIIESSKKAILGKMEREIELTMGQSIRNEIELNQTLRNLESKPQIATNLSQNQLALINVYRLLANSDYTSALESKKNENGEEMPVFSREKLLKVNPKLSSVELDAIESSIHFYMSKLYSGEADEMSANLYIQSFIIQDGPSSQEEIIWNMLRSMKSEYQKISEEFFFPELMWNFDSAIINKVEKKQVLDVREKIEMVEMAKNVFTISMIITDANMLDKFSKVPYTQDQAIKDLIANYNKSVGVVFNDKTQLKNLFAEAKDQCVVTLTKSYADSPTEEENAAALAILAQIQNASNDLIEKEKGQSLSEKLNIKFQLPMNQTEALNQWKKYFASAQASMSDLRTKMNGLNLNDKIGSHVITALFFRYFSSAGFFDQVQEICEKSTPAFIDDAAHPAENVFKASWVTVKHLSYGVGIMAHEVGHIVSYKYPDLFKSQKSCLSDKNKTELYVEEDFADLFSSKILLKLKSNGVLKEATNMSCGLGDVTRTKPEDFSTTNHMEFDNHSSQLYRILSVAAALGQSTTQCQQYLNKYEPKAEIFKNYCSF